MTILIPFFNILLSYYLILISIRCTKSTQRKGRRFYGNRFWKPWNNNYPILSIRICKINWNKSPIREIEYHRWKVKDSFMNKYVGI